MAAQHITKNGKRRRNFYLPEVLMDEAGAWAEKRGKTLTDVVETAIRKYMEAVRRAEQK